MLAIVTLTSGGKKTAESLKESFGGDVIIYSKPFGKTFKEVVVHVFENYDQILFIMASGIVVRTIGPLLEHKSKDPAILVMDEKARFIISLVSGHLGGANKLAEDISEVLENCQPVITTSSDVNNLLSVDMLAKKYGLILKDFNGAKEVTAELVDGFKVGVISELEVKEDNYTDDIDGVSAIVEISNKIKNHDTALPYVKLINKNLVLGIGCKRNTPYGDLEAYVETFLEENGYMIESVSSLSSAWIKSDEVAINRLAEVLGIDFLTYQKEEIKLVEDRFLQSEFVNKTLGVGAVSEPCGYLASNKGKNLVGIRKHNGMTLSLWEMKGI